MRKEDVDFSQFAASPGIYIFRSTRNTVLYVGRATNLRSRIRSYFSERLLDNRGPRLVEALEKTKRIDVILTDSVLEAYILEAEYIKRYEPLYNVADKDDKSFQYVCITREDFPRVLVVRGREFKQGTVTAPFSHIFGPFPRGSLLKQALRILRKILPYRDTCAPYIPEKNIKKSAQSAVMPKPCFNAQLKLCPGVCVGDMNKKEYSKRIREIVLFFSGKKKQLLTMLEKEMNRNAKVREFEKAEEIRRRVFALTHIQDVALASQEWSTERNNPDRGLKKPVVSRIEAYDVAHLRGTHTVGVMVVSVDGDMIPSEYRTFTIRSAPKGDDIAALCEILQRRLRHPEWQFPDLIVVDGGKAHISAARRVLKESDMRTPVVSVVKTDRHTPRAVLGPSEYVSDFEKDIIFVNNKAHRAALARHRRKRSKGMF